MATRSHFSCGVASKTRSLEIVTGSFIAAM
jgi:hypothetical protein